MNYRRTIITVVVMSLFLAGVFSVAVQALRLPLEAAWFISGTVLLFFLLSIFNFMRSTKKDEQSTEPLGKMGSKPIIRIVVVFVLGPLLAGILSFLFPELGLAIVVTVMAFVLLFAAFMR